jgi:hypothetical protein
VIYVNGQVDSPVRIDSRAPYNLDRSTGYKSCVQVPQGRSRIARRFIAGGAVKRQRVPSGTKEQARFARCFYRPSGAFASSHRNPRLKPWSIVGRPCRGLRSLIFRNRQPHRKHQPLSSWSAVPTRRVGTADHEEREILTSFRHPGLHSVCPELFSFTRPGLPDWRATLASTQNHKVALPASWRSIGNSRGARTPS